MRSWGCRFLAVFAVVVLCTPPVAVAVCGDGVLDPGEQCDDGNRNNCDGCSSQCRSEPAGASWCFVGGPQGGHTFSLAIDPTTPSTIYAGTQGVLFKSTDAGLSWLPSSTGFSGTEVVSIAIKPDQPSVLLAGSVVAGNTPPMINRSDDAGVSWNYTNGNGGGSIVFDPSNPNIVYGLNMRSQDAGQTWESQGQPGMCATAIAATMTDVIYGLAPATGLFKSTDAGTTWTLVNADVGLLANDPWFCGLAIDPSDVRRIYFGATDGAYRSDDGGYSFAKVLGSGPLRPWPHAIVISPLDGAIFVGAAFSPGDGLYKSMDGGNTWMTRLVGHRILAIAIDPQSPNVMYAGTGAGVFRSNDAGDTWVLRTAGVNAASITTFARRATDAALFAGTDTVGVWFRAPGTTTWEPRNAGLPPDQTVWTLVTSPQAPSTLYATVAGEDGKPKGVFKSTDDGNSWQSVLDDSYSGYGLAIDPSNPNIVYADTLYSMYKTVDGGANWSLLHGVAGGIFTPIAVDPVYPLTVYAGGTNPSKSTDGGANWVSFNLPPSGDCTATYIWGMLIDPSDSSVIYASTGCGLYKSADRGATWRNTAPILTSSPEDAALTIDENDPSHLFAALQSTGVYASEDAGGTWTPLSNEGMPNLFIRALIVSGGSATPTGPQRAELPLPSALLLAATGTAGGESGIFQKVTGPPAATAMIPGGGTSAHDCIHEWSAALIPARNSMGIPVSRQLCTDDDPACDFGPPGDSSCTFRVRLCFNVAEQRFPCTASDVGQVQLAAPQGGVAAANRDGLEASLRGLGGTVHGKCKGGSLKRGQPCSSDGDCGASAGSGNGKCDNRIVAFTPSLTATDRCAGFTAIRVPLRKTAHGFTRASATLRLKALPSKDPVTGKKRASDTDSLTLECKPPRLATRPPQ
ncbi:MAG: hypothetical protein HY270_09765 [Deltaproteobacteria bacterium]|nr:hypothetical protein [Deltaproteobacteria bacterium]